jgi:hypothetical protein
VPDVGPRAGPVLNDEWLAKPLRQPLTDQARNDVPAPARGKADDDANRPRWIDLRSRDTRHGRQRSSTSGQMQKSTARSHADKLRAVTVKGQGRHAAPPGIREKAAIRRFEG